MEVIFLFVVLAIGFAIWYFVTSFGRSREQTMAGRKTLANWRDGVARELGLVDVVGSGTLIGQNLERRATAIVARNGSGQWIPFDAVAGVELTPVYSTFEEGQSETTTRRGAQIVGAGIGAAVAGPAGLVVGGLSGGSRTEFRSSSTEVLDSMELKLRLFSETEPLIKMSFANAPYFNSETQKFEGGIDELERLAARLATQIERRDASAEKPRFESFEQITTREAPRVQAGYWSDTFGD